jgi:Raf kinase inhibitor-like YbhB/YbcL family protein
MGFALSDMQLTSPAFAAGGAIPRKHTGEGDDVSPALAWAAAPPQARSFAVFCHDPDAPLITRGHYGYVHWVLYNIPASVSGLAEGEDDGYSSGRNDFGKPGYGGPMPPEGHGTHYYFYWILALDTDSKFPAGLTLWQFLEQAEPHVIAMNRLVGTYRRG